MQHSSQAAGVSTPNANHSTHFDHRMKLYSAAAIAAGVSALALAQPAESEVIVTRQQIKVPYWNSSGQPASVALDLNGDGVNDFYFSIYTFAYHTFRESF